MAASATFALKSGEWFRRVRFVIFAPDSHAQPCALSGRDSTHRTDRNCGATSGNLVAMGLLGGVWLTAVAGIILKLLLPGRFDRLAVVLYLLLGWSGAVVYEPVVT